LGVDVLHAPQNVGIKRVNYSFEVKYNKAYSFKDIIIGKEGSEDSLSSDVHLPLQSRSPQKNISAWKIQNPLDVVDSVEAAELLFTPRMFVQ
jgi:hypothetical protein